MALASSTRFARTKGGGNGRLSSEAWAAFASSDLALLPLFLSSSSSNACVGIPLNPGKGRTRLSGSLSKDFAALLSPLTLHVDSDEPLPCEAAATPPALLLAPGQLLRCPAVRSLGSVRLLAGVRCRGHRVAPEEPDAVARLNHYDAVGFLANATPAAGSAGMACSSFVSPRIDEKGGLPDNALFHLPVVQPYIYASESFAHVGEDLVGLMMWHSVVWWVGSEMRGPVSALTRIAGTRRRSQAG